MVTLRILVNVAVIALIMELAMAANYTVGAPNGGWDLMTSLQAWANSKNFSVGDSLTFVYAPNHDILEVSKPDYDACQTNNPVGSYSGGMTVITLSSSGNRYFICGSQGHCDRGMKVVITTLGASAPPPASAAVPPPPAAAPGTPSAPSPAISPVPSTAPSKTTAPVQAPSSKAPVVSPSKTPATAPASSPSISTTTQSPAIPPFPDAASPSTTTPSSASEVRAFAGTMIGFGTVIMMLATL